MRKRSLVFLVAALTGVLGSLTIAVPLFAADVVNVLHNFGPHPDGAYPIASLIFDKSGNLYGTTFLGGEYECGYEHGCGTIFQLTPEGNGQWKETVLHNFTGGEDGCGPSANLIFDRAGNLYGTASGSGYGGPCNNGTLFELSPGTNDTWTFKVLHSFAGDTDGTYPAGLIFDAAGNLYGVTAEGGPSGGGTVFELSFGTNGAWTVKVLHYFSYGGQDGFLPVGSLTFDRAGNLYGITCCGGGQSSACPYNFGCGTLFELTPITTGITGEWTERVLHTFNYTDGDNAASGLTSDIDGNLYGTTQSGGVFGYGVVFQLSPGANGDWTEKLLHSFSTNNGDGTSPAGELIFDAAGNLYGTTTYGGAFGSNCGSYNCGTVFELTPGSTTASWSEKVLHRFDGDDGAFPEAGVVFDSAGNLYGDVSSDGAFGSTCGFYFRNGVCGTVFELTP